MRAIDSPHEITPRNMILREKFEKFSIFASIHTPISLNQGSNLNYFSIKFFLKTPLVIQNNKKPHDKSRFRRLDPEFSNRARFIDHIKEYGKSPTSSYMLLISSLVIKIGKNAIIVGHK
jgi:hypothetical protein